MSPEKQNILLELERRGSLGDKRQSVVDELRRRDKFPAALNAEPPGTIDSFFSGFGAGVKSIGQGAAQIGAEVSGNEDFKRVIADSIRNDAEATRQLEESLGGGFFNSANIGKIAGEVVGTLPIFALASLAGAGGAAVVGARFAPSLVKKGVQSVINFARNAANKTPAVVGAAAGGAVGGGLIPTNPDKDFATQKKEQLAIGAFGGVAVPALIKGAIGAGKKFGDLTISIKNKLGGLLQDANPNIQAVDNLGVLTPEGEQTLKRVFEETGLTTQNVSSPRVAEQLNVTGTAIKQGVLTPLEQARQLRAIGGGVQPTEGQLAIDTAMQLEEQNIARTTFTGLTDPGNNPAARITQRQAENTQAIVDTLRAGVAKPPEKTVFGTGAGITKTIKGKRKEEKAQVSDKFEAAKIAQGADDSVPFGDLRNKLTDVLKETRLNLDKTVSAEIRRLKLTEKVSGKPSIGQLLGESPGKLRGATFNDIRKLLKTINSKKKAPSLGEAERQALGQVKNVLDEALDTADTTAVKLFREANKAAVPVFDEFGTKFVKSVVSGKINPEQAVDKITKASVEDVQGLIKLFSTGTSEQRAAGKFSVASLRAGMMEQIFKKSQIQNKTQVGDVAISGVKLTNILETIGPERLSAVFTRSQVKALKSIQQLIKDITPIKTTLNPSGTASALGQLAKGATGGPRIGIINRVIRDTAKLIGRLKKEAQQSLRATELLNPVERRIIKQVKTKSKRLTLNLAPSSGAVLTGQAQN